jgi:hypothetical protein
MKSVLFVGETRAGCREAQCTGTDTADFRYTVASAVEVEVMFLFLWVASPQVPLTADICTRASGADDVEILQCRIHTIPTEMKPRIYFNVEAR